MACDTASASQPLPSHTTVLLHEAIKALNVKIDGTYVDGTFGRGGHARELASQLNAGAHLLLMDRDPQAIEAARLSYADDSRVSIVHASFSNLKSILEARGLFGQVDGILLDLGVSSPQLDEAERGFSFQTDGALDMRMDTTSGETAAEWLDAVDEYELVSVLRRFGEEKFARRIARAVIETRAEQAIETTRQLATIISDAVPIFEKGKHPATRSFQAIRIVVNGELDELDAVLPDAFDALKPGGRLVIISFHSLEDRRVKRFMQREAKGDPYPPDLPIPASAIQPRLKLIGKPIRVSQTELTANRRSRSAIMRIAEKVR